MPDSCPESADASHERGKNHDEKTAPPVLRPACRHDGSVRTRRRLREIARLNAEHTKQGYDLILVARSRAVNAEYQKLEADVLHCFEQLQLLKKDGAE